ncbi:hypothetical protein N7452_000645 [Penicillium brevicompactum]|uniref:UBC core domain-containing protein n=1 Tax=Penicillium brevicompactum TaxID=5074 RepID=A0A9W9UR31_PENBR|nr:hypothetical protein N7452_000645 [Penicillium brevicompactum]
MSTSKLPCIPSLRKQQLHLEFASLKHAAPPGVYVSLAPGDPTLWNGVIFVRSGPYASAVLRLQLRFPDTYPDLPPTVTFATDLFHPLIVPLTTYTFSTGSASDNPVSATDEGRLSPGGFSLRHGFPHWFGRAKRGGLASGATPRNVSGVSSTAPASEEQSPEEPVTHDGASDVSEPPVALNTEPAASGDDGTNPPLAKVPVDHIAEPRKIVPVSEILNYIRSTFDDESVLDSLPVEVAGNPGAWHAWRAHRRGVSGPGHFKRESPQARLPGDWHWDGIWARRVQDEIENSRSEPMLFGSSARGVDEMIRFSRLDDTTSNSVKEKITAMAEHGI